MQLLHITRRIFKPDVAYMEVPRCDRCAWWREWDEDLQPGRIGGIVPRLSAHAGVDLVKEFNLQKIGDCELFRRSSEAETPVHDEAKLTPNARGQVTVSTEADFGCVQFKAKGEADAGKPFQDPPPETP